jgi:hypothetical protein
LRIGFSPVVVLLGPAAPRLTETEVEDLFDFAFNVHHHDADFPPQPLFWHRTEEIVLSDFWN